MNPNLQEIIQSDRERFWLEITDKDLKAAEPIASEYSNHTGRKQAYINRLCLNVFLRWLKENCFLETEATVFPNEENLASIWEVVNGTAITIGKKRLVLIPSDAIDIKDFGVPQEWVDIPNWAADYYLPVQVDLENRYLYIWGFISRSTLKETSDRESIYRIYYVPRDYVLTDLNTLWIACNLCADEKGKIDALPTLSKKEATQLIEQLSKPSPYSPRLAAKFDRWGGLLNEMHWLQKLYQQRLEAIKPRSLVELNRWFDGIVEEGWQTFEEFFKAKKMVPALRSRRVRGVKLDMPEEIGRAIRQLYASQNEVSLPPHIAAKYRQIASYSVKVDFFADAEHQEALVHLLHHTHDESIRWKAAEYLSAMAPDAAIRNVMDLGTQLMGHRIALAIALLRKSEGQVAILLRAYPIEGQSKLPPGLRLMGLYENGEPIPGLEAISRSEPQDDYITLYFSADVGDRFSVRLAIESASITEQFVV
jgi:hypothetical protein